MAVSEVVCIDKCKQLIELLNFLQTSDYRELVYSIKKVILKLGLSDSARYGYEYYDCSSSSGLAKFNREPYKRLRELYNNSPDPLLFLVLIIFGFNNQIRFNSLGEFNLPVGKRDFNDVLSKRLGCFIGRLRENPIRFTHCDFRDLDARLLKKMNAFLYLDPPYSLGTASYNENGGWTEDDEKDLLNFLNECDIAGIRFALSRFCRH